jgi:hypothetical protein
MEHCLRGGRLGQRTSSGRMDPLELDDERFFVEQCSGLKFAGLSL